MQISRRALASSIAALCAGGVCHQPSFAREPLVLRPRLDRFKPFMFTRAMVKAIRHKFSPDQAKKFLRALRRPLYGTRGQKSPVTGYQYTYGQCCGILVAEESLIQTIWATVESIYQWIIENWETVLRILMSVLMFVVI